MAVSRKPNFGPKVGDFIEGDVIYVTKAAAELVQEDINELQLRGTIILLENDGTNTYAALGYASEVPTGWTEGSFTVA
jgi:hypothetical protein